MIDPGPSLHECAHAFAVDELRAMAPGTTVCMSGSTFDLAFPGFAFYQEFEGWGNQPGPLGSRKLTKPIGSNRYPSTRYDDDDETPF